MIRRPSKQQAKKSSRSGSGRTTRRDPDLLTIPEVAEALGLSIRTLRRYQANGRLKVTRIGRRVYCTLKDAHRAATDGLASLEASRMVDDRWRDRSVRDWLRMVQGFMGMISAPSRPLDLRRRYLEAITERYGDLKVSEYLLRHVDEVHQVAKRDGWWLADAEMLLVLPRDLPVIDALREVQARFAGLVPPTPVEPATNGRSPQVASARSGQAGTSQVEPDRRRGRRAS